MTSPVHIRPLAARDSFEALTALLHRAYAPLAALGLNFTAATQGPEETRRRAAEGQCLVAELEGQVVGTVTVCGPYEMDTAPWAAEAPWFRDPDTAHFHQFAVDPRVQGRGVGRLLVQACEQWARQRQFRRLALDTAVPAAALRGLYRRLGYTEVSEVQWPGKTYRSVVMLKALDRSPLRENLQVMARYNLWATKRLVAAVEPLSEADYRRDLGLAFRSIHGTLNHLQVAEHLLWRARFTEGVAEAVALDAEVEPERQRLAERLVDGALAWLPLLEVWPDGRLTGSLSYFATDGQPVSLPFAPTLLHVFNHGTHHRGQVSAALTALGRPAPVLDLARMLRDEAAAAA